MDKFTNDIMNIYELINTDKSSKTSISLINSTLLSKQYLAYYLYRIFTKFIQIFENSASTSEIKEIMKNLKIPQKHDLLKPYPLSGKMTNDEKLLDLIILSFFEIFNNTSKYIQTLPNDTGYTNLFNFLKMKDTKTIVQDLMDLQKLIPGLSVSAIRPNYMDDEYIP